MVQGYRARRRGRDWDGQGRGKEQERGAARTMGHGHKWTSHDPKKRGERGGGALRQPSQRRRHIETAVALETIAGHHWTQQHSPNVGCAGSSVSGSVECQIRQKRTGSSGLAYVRWQSRHTAGQGGGGRNGDRDGDGCWSGRVPGRESLWSAYKVVKDMETGKEKKPTSETTRAMRVREKQRKRAQQKKYKRAGKPGSLAWS